MQSKRFVLPPLIVIVLALIVRFSTDFPLFRGEDTLVTINHVMAGLQQADKVIVNAFEHAKNDKNIETMNTIFLEHNKLYKTNTNFILSGYHVLASIADLMIIIMAGFIFFSFKKRKKAIEKSIS